MTQRCTICRAPERKRIEKKLLSGPRRLRATAKEFGLSYHALRRHWVNHVTAEARAQYIVSGGVKRDELAAVVADENCSFLDHYKIVRARLYDALTEQTEIWYLSSPDGCTKICATARD
jgi:hypothetical protein